MCVLYVPYRQLSPLLSEYDATIKEQAEQITLYEVLAYVHQLTWFNYLECVSVGVEFFG